MGGLGKFAASVLLLGFVMAPSVADARDDQHQFGHFKVTVHFDTFSGKTSCLAHAQNIRLRDGIISFKFDPNISTDRALVRINAGNVIKSADYRTEIRSRQIFLATGSLENPDASRVNLPTRLFENAAFVDIRPNPDKRFIKHFKLNGLDAALTYMVEHSCPNEVQ